MLSDSQGCELSHFVLILKFQHPANPAFTVHVTRDATFDVTTSDVMFSEIVLMFDVYAMNLKLKRIFMKM